MIFYMCWPAISTNVIGRFYIILCIDDIIMVLCFSLWSDILHPDMLRWIPYNLIYKWKLKVLFGIKNKMFLVIIIIIKKLFYYS